MFAKVAVLLFAGCAVVLARPQDASTLQQAQQQLNPNPPQQAFTQPQRLNSNSFQGLNQNQLQALFSGQFQGLNPNQLQALFSSQLQGLNQNQAQAQLLGQFQGYNLNQLLGYPNQLQNLIPGLNNGFNGFNNGGYNGNTKYQTPLLELPNRAIDWGQNVIDGSVSRVGTALSQVFENTERVAKNAIDTVGEVGKRGFQDGSTIVKSRLGIFTAFPEIGLGLLSRQNNNNNNGYGY